jgi:hypothetical protein
LLVRLLKFPIDFVFDQEALFRLQNRWNLIMQVPNYMWPNDRAATMSNFPLRLPKDLMVDAKTFAKDQGVSVNQFLATVLAERVGDMKAMSRPKQKAAFADLSAGLAILKNAPDVAPMMGDEIA